LIAALLVASVVADYFPLQSEAAFANVIFFSGASAALGFFVFPNLSLEATVSGLCRARRTP
jgi:hypothetical protein